MTITLLSVSVVRKRVLEDVCDLVLLLCNYKVFSTTALLMQITKDVFLVHLYLHSMLGSRHFLYLRQVLRFRLGILCYRAKINLLVIFHRYIIDGPTWWSINFSLNNLLLFFIVHPVVDLDLLLLWLRLILMCLDL